MRYAIYFTPPEGSPLAVAASVWLGRDAFSDRKVKPVKPGILEVSEIPALTAEPRRYGFHGTLKAPFELRDGYCERDLLESFEAFASETECFDMADLTLGRLGDFFALVPGAFCPEIELLADRCVSQFDLFRRPSSDVDFARRKPEGLTESQLQNLRAWGYPYVFEDFRFHMTLTGPVPVERREAIRIELLDQFSDFIGKPLAVRDIALFVEPERDQPFTVLKILPLAGARQRKFA